MAIWSHSISRDNAIPRNGISPPFRTSHTHAQLINRPFAYFPHFSDNSRFELASSVAFRIFTRNFALLSLCFSSSRSRDSNQLRGPIYRFWGPLRILISIVSARLCSFSRGSSRDPFDVPSSAPSKRIRKRPRMRRNLLLISCSLMLLGLGVFGHTADV